MCGRYYRRSDKQRIAEAYRLGEIPFDLVLPDWNFNVAPTTFQPVIRMLEGRERGTEGLGTEGPGTEGLGTREQGTRELVPSGRELVPARELVLMRWGLVPSFTKQLSDVKGISTINARAETVRTSPVWRGPFRKRRCLVPADGFYEWKRGEAENSAGENSVGGKSGIDEESSLGAKNSLFAQGGAEEKRREKNRIENRPGEKTKRPYAFHMADNAPFAFAGLWDAWRAPDESWLLSFSIVTTEANALMAPVHNRMPVIVHPRDYDRWLRVEEDAAPLDLLRPYEAEAMACAPANPKVGNTRNNGPEMLAGA